MTRRRIDNAMDEHGHYYHMLPNGDQVCQGCGVRRWSGIPTRCISNPPPVLIQCTHCDKLVSDDDRHQRNTGHFTNQDIIRRSQTRRAHLQRTRFEQPSGRR